MQLNICLRDLPTQKNSTLPPRVPTHAYADCKISGQQPTHLYKEFPRVHEVGHWEKNDAQLTLQKMGHPCKRFFSGSLVRPSTHLNMLIRYNGTMPSLISWKSLHGKNTQKPLRNDREAPIFSQNTLELKSCLMIAISTVYKGFRSSWLDILYPFWAVPRWRDCWHVGLKLQRLTYSWKGCKKTYSYSNLSR